MKRGLTLIEIVVALVILSISMLGITNLLVSSKRYVRHSRCRTQAVNLARFYLEELGMYVRADQWQAGDYSNPLSSGHHIITENFWLGTPLIRYRLYYDVSGLDDFGMRRVKLEVKWIEPTFWQGYAY
jgi:prepilin-type N-terminal cleavage/methylation domain-containing protein